MTNPTIPESDAQAKAWEIIGEHMSPDQKVSDPEALALDIAATFDAISAISARRIPPADNAVAVKALEWREERHNSDATTYWFASTPWGRMQIDHPDDHMFAADYTGGRYLLCFWHGLPRQRFETLEQAQAAAQSDYETRIRSALEPTPSYAEGRAAGLRDDTDDFDLAERLADAMEANSFRLGQVQGFGRKGELYIRDCWLKEAQTIWVMKYDGDDQGPGYKAAHVKMTRRIEVERLSIALSIVRPHPTDNDHGDI